ncbi:hypothetical protein [Hymenobacter yonginensis]|uniref:Uncharacterized protein n=1 Tax=Hymenobacter yonginensis TaxID=748197 RepID=A0ABY7PQV2_9BACT|nr:hypothetical protein [Hymenobacter yonginensis]WBO85240.1 hypothetical protein O9Z63_03125 [Hymenobacter yonginensis]
MQTEEINQAVQLFDTPEKWSAFLALADQKEVLRQAMYRTAFVRISSHFLKDHQVEGWSFKPLDSSELAMVWYLTQYGEFSICLVMAWKGEFVLEVRGGDRNYKVDEAARLLADSRFNTLLSCFERIDKGVEREYLAREKFNFSFGSPSDTRFGPFRLAWYAQFETEKLLEQIITKVSRFQTPEMTALLGDFNRMARK